MKKFALIMISLLIAGNIFSQNREFTLNGKLPNSLKDGWSVYLYSLSEQDMSPILLDSTKVETGQFLIKNTIDNSQELKIVRLVDPTGEKDVVNHLIIEPGTIDLYIDDTFIVKNSPANENYAAFKESLDTISYKMKEINQAMQAPDASPSLAQDFDSLADQFQKETFNYIYKNIDNKVGEIFFLSYGSYLRPEQIKELYDSLRPAFQSTKMVKYLMDTYVNTKEDVVIGSKFIDVELSTPAGSKAMMSDYVGNGKVVLIDFWASWCGPCIKEMPQIVSLYNKFKDQNFEIVGVSLDDHKGRWTTAIDRMNMTWIQLSDFGGWDSVAARLYGVSQIPQSFLVDKDGTVVAHDLHGNELIRKIESLLKEE
ncbi:TlpA disulfide reductase family protein [Dysgonomonas sp. ZJ279]|uniref:TlpA disulfide reductase family protein n=1 Tax=Dysgonomonas sp. ZJ279 TaxID=2709796 RepID=UPI0013ECC8A8|nr:TlpA disulfide reductase family protein [Dysgonomonas sp. ZJ279]